MSTADIGRKVRDAAERHRVEARDHIETAGAIEAAWQDRDWLALYRMGAISERDARQMGGEQLAAAITHLMRQPRRRRGSVVKSSRRRTSRAERHARRP